jgi:hypothetical protein
MKDKELKVQVHLDDELTQEYISSELLTHELRQSDPDEFGSQAIDPLSISLIIGSAYALALLVVSIYERLRGGVVVDLTGIYPDIYRDHDIPHGWMIVIAKDGKVELEAKDIPRDSLERIVEKVIELGVGTAKSAVEAVFQDSTKSAT